MARASITTQPVVPAGLNPLLTQAVVDGDIVDVGRVALWVNNGSGASITVTVQPTYSRDGLDLEPLVVAVPAGAFRLIGPLPARTYAQPFDAVIGAGRALVDYSAVTTVTRGVISL